MVNRIAALLYGIVCYVFFLAVFLYAIGFIGNVAVPKSIDSGPASPWQEALVIDAVLLSLFAVQHSGMARVGFKRAWTRIVPAPVERSTYVLIASAVLALVMWQWRPIPSSIWDVQNGSGRVALQALFWLGWFGVLLSTWLVDHFGLFGLRQVYAYFKGVPYENPKFKTPALYKLVRHPLYLGFIIAFWSTPRMTAGHLFFAVMCTAYIVVAIQFEERDLMHFYGEAYRTYRQQVSMLIPLRFRAAERAKRHAAR
jgi:protein-S-isoprenylcysteine O-methyltransferase Ste14